MANSYYSQVGIVLFGSYIVLKKVYYKYLCDSLTTDSTYKSRLAFLVRTGTGGSLFHTQVTSV